MLLDGLGHPGSPSTNALIRRYGAPKEGPPRALLASDAAMRTFESTKLTGHMREALGQKGRAAFWVVRNGERSVECAAGRC